MNFTLQCEECTMTPYADGYDVIIRGKLYFGFKEGEKLILYKDDDEVGFIMNNELYNMTMDGTPIEQEYYFEGRFYKRNDEQLMSNCGKYVIAYLENNEWVWLVDYTKEGKLI